MNNVTGGKKDFPHRSHSNSQLYIYYFVLTSFNE